METESQKTKETEETDKIQYYFNQNRFKHLLRETKKYRDLYASKEAIISLLLSLITVFLILSVAHGISSLSTLNIILDNEFAKGNLIRVIDLIKGLLNINLAGLFGLLGFIIGGLSILSGTISVKVIDSINDEGKIKHLIRIMFSFYYTGALIGVTIVFSLFSYISTYTQFQMNIYVLVIWSLILSYISYFTIITCVMLMGTSLRFFLLNHWYYLKQKDSDETQKEFGVSGRVDEKLSIGNSNINEQKGKQQ